MKTSIVLFISVFVFVINLCAQDASSYFPADPGFTWKYKIIPLDLANNEVDTSTFYQLDSFAVVQDYKGKTANVIITKRDTSLGVPFNPLTYVSFEGSNAYLYYLINIDSLINSVGSAKIIAKTSIVNNVGGWELFYNFAQSENASYQILKIDTTVNYKGLKLQGRYEMIGMRLADQEVETDAGNFNCKKFVIDNNVYVKLIGDYSKIFTIPDTVWIAENQWIVQDITPSVTTNPLGLGEIHIPGSKKVVTVQTPTSINVDNFKLYQNYPNPFNPGTIIKYSLPENSNVELIIYDLLGNEITTLVDKEQSAGNYEVVFNPSQIKNGISTGVYFYTLRTGSASLTKKLIYLK